MAAIGDSSVQANAALHELIGRRNLLDLERPGRSIGSRLVAGQAWRLVQAADRVTRLVSRSRVDQDWPRALAMLPLTRLAERGDLEAIGRLRGECDRLVSSEGGWQRQIAGPSQAIHGYNLIHLQRRTPEPRYERALRAMAGFLLSEFPRAADGCLPYSRHSDLLLVDTLGLLSPFLAAYGTLFHDPAAVALAHHQLATFIATNLDPETYLPFHAYRAAGPRRLGLHGWGRGVGWYLIGLVETLIEAPGDAAPQFLEALARSAAALRRFQRADGHWSWVVPLPGEHLDSSATSFCGYALARARKAGLIGGEYDSVIDHALTALLRETRPDGTVTGSSGECAGVGTYSGSYGPELWLQGTTAALCCVWSKPATPTQ